MKNNYKEMGFVNFINTEALIHDLKLLGNITVMVLGWLLAQLMCMVILIIAAIKFTIVSAIESGKFYWKVLCASWEFARKHIFPVVVNFFICAFNKIMEHLNALKGKVVTAEAWRMEMAFNQWDMIKYRTELAKLTVNNPMIEDDTMVVANV